MKNNKIINTLSKLEVSELVRLWNEFAYENNEQVIYENSEREINEVLTPYDALKGAGDYYSLDDDYFVLNCDGSLESFTWVIENTCPIDIELLATWLEQNQENWDKLGFSLR